MRKIVRKGQSEPIARAVAGVLLYLLSNYWHTLGVGVPEAEKLMAQIDSALHQELTEGGEDGG